MLLSTLNPEIDMHGYGLGVAIFGTSVGALMAFAGVVTFFKSSWFFFGQLPFVLYVCISCYVFQANYA